jgi:hypothetical protein
VREIKSRLSRDPGSDTRTNPQRQRKRKRERKRERERERGIPASVGESESRGDFALSSHAQGRRNFCSSCLGLRNLHMEGKRK